MVSRNRYYCLICKKLADKDRKKGLINKYYLSSMLCFDNKKEAENHIKKSHPKEWAEIAETTGENKNGK